MTMNDGKCRGHQFPSVAARLDAERDFTEVYARVIPAGRCTGCEADADTIQWGTAERLCYLCVSRQVDLLAVALREGNVLALNTSPKVVWA